MKEERKHEKKLLRQYKCKYRDTNTETYTNIYLLLNLFFILSINRLIE